MITRLMISNNNRMTIDGERIDPSLVAMVCAREGEPELLVLDGYDGTGDVIHRAPLPVIGNYVDLDACSKIVRELGYQLVLAVQEGLTEPPGVWTDTGGPNGWVATAVWALALGTRVTSNPEYWRGASGWVSAVGRSGPYGTMTGTVVAIQPEGPSIGVALDDTPHVIQWGRPGAWLPVAEG